MATIKSIEEKAKSYDEAIERARDFMNGEVHYALKKGENIVCWIFPELRESEDERIRKDIISYIQVANQVIPQFQKDKWIAWLEKQGESHTKRDVDDAYLKGVTDAKKEIEKQYEANYQIRKDIATFIFNYRGDIKDRAKWMDYLGIKVSFIKKQGEQKPTNEVGNYDHKEVLQTILNEQKPTDKVEPKFHKGDWVVYECGEDSATLQIKNIVYGTYEFTDDSTLNVVDEDTLRLWTIKDAKDGDVLYSPCCKLLWVYKDEKTCYVGSNLNYNSGSIVTNKPVCIPTDVQPATKEQREQLEKAMADAGYTFNFEKKELEKIEQTSANETPYPETLEKAIDLYYNSYGNGEGEFEHLSLEKFRDIVHTFVSDYGQKPAWSEEDASLYARIQGILSVCKSHSLLSPDLYKEMCDWLKSLRPQNRWKPSDEQTEAVRLAAEIGTANNSWAMGILKSMYQDLKKLKG